MYAMYVSSHKLFFIRIFADFFKLSLFHVKLKFTKCRTFIPLLLLPLQ